MRLEYGELSNTYEVRCITEENLEEVFQLCKDNAYYYEHMNSVVDGQNMAGRCSV